MSEMLVMNWDTMHIDSRREVLEQGPIRTSYVINKKWADIESWMRDDITHELERRSRGTVTLAKATC